MKLIDKTLKNKYCITSKYGYRICPFHGREFHHGVDYGTYGNKYKIYALEEGYVQKVHRGTKGYGNYIWVRYPRINLSLMYAHLDKIYLKTKDKVSDDTIIGICGKSGDATGIHLHLGMTLIGSDTWINPDNYNYKEINNSKDKIYIVKKGDSLWSIAKKYYNNGNKYVMIADKNKIKKPYVIYPNQKLIMP